MAQMTSALSLRHIAMVALQLMVEQWPEGVTLDDPPDPPPYREGDSAMVARDSSSGLWIMALLARRHMEYKVDLTLFVIPRGHPGVRSTSEIDAGDLMSMAPEAMIEGYIRPGVEGIIKRLKEEQVKP